MAPPNRTRRTVRSLALAASGAVATGVPLLPPISREVSRTGAPLASIAAEAARRVGAGDDDIVVPTERQDEVGELARAVDPMARGLHERRRFRDVSGEYMASQIVHDLLDRGDVSLAVELREGTVLITDIRNDTALTEQLGASEVVGLLHEDFSIFVEVMLRGDGVIDTFMRDALLYWFGTPVPLKDHAQRAVEAAAAMLLRTARLERGPCRAGASAHPHGDRHRHGDGRRGKPRVPRAPGIHRHAPLHPPRGRMSLPG